MTDFCSLAMRAMGLSPASPTCKLKTEPARRSCRCRRAPGSLPPAVIGEGADLSVAAVTNEGRLLIFPLSDLPELARGKGNKIIGIPSARAAAREELLVGLCTLQSADVLQVTAGRQHLKLKFSDLEHYRGERGRRGNKLPKGFQKVAGFGVLQSA